VNGRPRILLVSHYFPPHLGGIENVVAQEARHLAEAGADVTVLTTGRPGDETTLSGVRIMRQRAWDGIEHRTGVPFPVPGPAIVALARSLARWADVVHLHDGAYATSWAAAAAAAATGTPFVMTQHVALVDHPAAVVRLVQRAVWSTAGRALLRRAERVFVLNDTVAAFVRDHGARPGRVGLLPNGVDAALFSPCPSDDERRALRVRLGLPADRILVLFAGRLVPKKGHELLRSAAGPEYDLVFAGDGREGTPPSEPGVHYLGRLDQPGLAAAYRACDVFALPSTSEGFPLTVQEAMACGLPVVTTDDPGYRPYRLDREHIRLVPRDARVLRETLTELAADPARRRAMGDWSRRYALDTFSWHRHAAELLERYPLDIGKAASTS
jgi:glycosyltransferase involved in cell wall biosynthesis